MSEPAPKPPENSGPVPAAPGMVKLVLALLCSVVAVAVAYRSLTQPADNFVDPIAAQAAIDRADVVVDQKEVIEGNLRIRTITHKSGKVDVFQAEVVPTKLPTSSSAGGGSNQGKGALKKKADDAKTK